MVMAQVHISVSELVSCAFSTISILCPLACRIMYTSVNAFLGFLGVDVSVEHSSDGMRGVDDGVRNLVCIT